MGALRRGAGIGRARRRGGGVLLPSFSESRSACIFSESQSSTVFGGGAGSASTIGRVGVESADLADLEDLGLREA